MHGLNYQPSTRKDLSRDRKSTSPRYCSITVRTVRSTMRMKRSVVAARVMVLLRIPMIQMFTSIVITVRAKDS